MTNNHRHIITTAVTLLFLTCTSSASFTETNSKKNDNNKKDEFATVVGGGNCQNDMDCRLNGLCEDTVCKCDAAWMGSNCNLLNLLPAPNHYSFHGKTKDKTSWGGSVLSHSPNEQKKSQDEQESDVTFYMYAAEMTNSCGLRDWKTNSAVVVATSNDPAGPYVEQEQIISTWAHNPQAIHIPKGDSSAEGEEDVWAVYTLGDGDGTPIHGPPRDCIDGDNEGAFIPDLDEMSLSPRTLVQHEATLRSRRLNSSNNNENTNKTVHFTIHYSTESPLGPFQKHTATILDFPSHYAFPGNWNPAPVVLPPNDNGKHGVRIMVHTNYPTEWSGSVIIEASSWKGPYRPITRDITSCVKCQEDPYVWLDHRGYWHALFHRIFDPIHTTTTPPLPLDESLDEKDDDYYNNQKPHNHNDKPNPIPSPGWSGGHAYSIDGLVWSDIERCYTTKVRFQDGTSREMLRRERPKLIFDHANNNKNVPTHLVNGVMDSVYGTYTLVTPLNTE